MSLSYMVSFTGPARHFNSFSNWIVFLKQANPLLGKQKQNDRERKLDHIAGFLNKTVLGLYINEFYTTQTTSSRTQIELTLLTSGHFIQVVVKQISVGWNQVREKFIKHWGWFLFLLLEANAKFYPNLVFS